LIQLRLGFLSIMFSTGRTIVFFLSPSEEFIRACITVFLWSFCQFPSYGTMLHLMCYREALQPHFLRTGSVFLIAALVISRPQKFFCLRFLTSPIPLRQTAPNGHPFFPPRPIRVILSVNFIFFFSFWQILQASFSLLVARYMTPPSRFPPTARVDSLPFFFPPLQHEL